MKTHIWVCIFAVLANGSAQPFQFDVFTKAGRQAYSRGDYAEAEKQFLAAVKELENSGANLLLATALKDLAGVYLTQQRNTEAESPYKRSLAILEPKFSDDPQVATIFGFLGVLHSRLKKYPEAESDYKRAILIREKALGAEHLDVAASLVDLGGMYLDQQRFADAEPVFKRALAIQEKALDPEDNHLVVPMVALAAIYLGVGKYPSVAPLLKRAVAIQEKAPPSSQDSDVADTLEQSVEVLRKVNRSTEATELQALAKGLRGRKRR